jgi:uncharacterized protein (TIGR01777 family)
MKIVVAGASGLIGRALVAALRERGHDVRPLVRRVPADDREIFWNPAARELDAARLEGIDAVVNLAGENIAGGRWTASRREKILRSRVDATQTLVTACARLARKPAVFLSASAVGYYGDAGDTELSENSPPGLGFLPEVSLIWETNAEGAARAGIRTVLLRFGVVLAREGGALAKMLPVFRLGLGGRLGDGKQWMSWVSLTDAVAAILHALGDSHCQGPINVVAPAPVTNAEFTKTLAARLGLPALFPVPKWVLRVVFGEMAEATLLVSTRATPARLQATGFRFLHETLDAALRAELG